MYDQDPGLFWDFIWAIALGFVLGVFLGML